MQSIFATILFIAAAHAECVAQPNIDTCVAQYRSSIKATCGMAVTVDACYCQSLPALAACYQHCPDVPANAQGRDEVLRDMGIRCEAAKSNNPVYGTIPQPTAMSSPSSQTTQSSKAYVSDPALNTSLPNATTIPSLNQPQTMSSQSAISSLINSTALPASNKTETKSSDVGDSSNKPSKSTKPKNVDDSISSAASSTSYSAYLCACITLLAIFQYL
ncbi:hypothetical protein DSO57_1034120 [Entomophthora muscae]|uniref:Uncharacterized protein n=1 Tax=Entomophthora muscae TaxID=34485 RepID=A0ACC2RQX2_9FUNG|nr:hypothetical protein DSO57_1034120 [Entomophthora muscae]